MDLRSNPGGDSDATALSAGYFTGSHIMLHFRDSAGNYHHTYLSESYPDLTDKPVIILTSSHSASGSELFAGDIRDYGAGRSMLTVCHPASVAAAAKAAASALLPPWPWR